MVLKSFALLLGCTVHNFYCWGGGGGGLIHETKIPMQELQLKMQGGLCARQSKA